MMEEDFNVDDFNLEPTKEGEIFNDHVEAETSIARSMFDLEKFIELQKCHDVQVIRGSDYQYLLYIDKLAFAPSLTPFGAISLGMKSYSDWLIKKGKGQN